MGTKAAALADVVAAGLAAWVAEAPAAGLAGGVVLPGAAPLQAASPPISMIDIAVVTRPGPPARAPALGSDPRHRPMGPPPWTGRTAGRCEVMVAAASPDRAHAGPEGQRQDINSDTAGESDTSRSRTRPPQTGHSPAGRPFARLENPSSTIHTKNDLLRHRDQALPRVTEGRRGSGRGNRAGGAGRRAASTVRGRWRRRGRPAR